MAVIECLLYASPGLSIWCPGRVRAGNQCLTHTVLLEDRDAGSQGKGPEAVSSSELQGGKILSL